MKIDSSDYGVASKVVKTFAMSVLRIRGNSTPDGWLQLFDAKAVPAPGTVPKRSFPVYATAPFDVILSGTSIELVNGCVLALSSTQGTYTALASTMDLFVTGQSLHDDSTWTTVGDYTTGTATRDGFASPGNGKKLKRLEFTALSAFGATLYWKVFAVPVVSLDVGMKPVVEGKLSNNTSADLSFDEVIKAVYSNISNNLQSALSVFIDSAPGPIVGDYVGTNYAIKISYES